jgi:adhesin transport system outer membrane protein
LLAGPAAVKPAPAGAADPARLEGAGEQPAAAEKTAEITAAAPRKAKTAAPTPAKAQDPIYEAPVTPETGDPLEKVANAPPELDGYKTNLDSMRSPALKRQPVKGVPRTLADVVLTAISDNALIKAGEGGAAEALSAVGAASASLYPQLQGRLAVGQSANSTWQAGKSSTTPYYDRKQTYGALRGDLGLTGEQLIYDFGSTRSHIAKAAAGVEAQNWSVLSTTEDVAFKTASAYLKILEQRELMDLATDNLVSLQEIAFLVTENQKNGNGTVADVKRVNARVIDAASLKADQDYALKLASDELRRFIHMEPGPLGPPPSLSRQLPADEKKAFTDALKTNPSIQAYRANIAARQNEIRALKQGDKPKVFAEIGATNRQYQAVNDKTEIDMSAMLAVRYKFLDGGFSKSQIEGVQARMLVDEMRMRDERETIENDLRQYYFTIKLARGKTESLAEGVDLNAKARALYREQFQGGKRSLLELLEVQQAYYTSKRQQITNQFEERRANFSILRSMGRFAATVLTFR